ncbi:RidA/YER057c/UK114 superfamily, group 1 [hydrothermal vent metagenome]|uniref:RidA/YER057c/UK114 superfamily, group 1 n=1 Tax=hydrothermal vent metagenome TaxID=652676 RepID=A0A3B0TDB8_9ZZZZ
MAGNVNAKLKSLGITLPRAAVPAANYVPVRRTGNLLIVSGQVPIADGKPVFVGVLGAGIDLEDGIAAARLCGLHVLAQASGALGGDLDRITACLRLGVFVAATANFTDHPKVANGASDLMVEVLGEAGRHARAAVGTTSLPFGVAVEVDAMFEVS